METVKVELNGYFWRAVIIVADLAQVGRYT